MPFKSAKQRGYLFAQKPSVARQFTKHSGGAKRKGRGKSGKGRGRGGRR